MGKMRCAIEGCEATHSRVINTERVSAFVTKRTRRCEGAEGHLFETFEVIENMDITEQPDVIDPVDKLRIETTAATLRYSAGIMFSLDEKMAKALYGVAEELERVEDVTAWICCPVCEEVICDGGCPLASIKRDPGEEEVSA